MTTLLRVLRFVLAIGTPSETNYMRLVEVLCAVVVTVNLAAAWTHDPTPVRERVFYACWSTQLHCREMEAEAWHRRADAINEAREGL